ncbi:MAG: hypothetical protein IK026_02700 [Eubacteriaceae bacterium]|nr:hypothetical protein [Eubacteriaceae bacterium]
MKKKFFSLIILTAAILIATFAFSEEAFAEGGPAVPDSLTCTVGGVTTRAAFGSSIELDPETPLSGSGTVTFASSKPGFIPTTASLNLTDNEGKQGSVTVTFKADGYEDNPCTITFHVKQGNMNASAADVSVQYNGEPHEIEVKVTGTSNYSIYYSPDTALNSGNYSTAGSQTPPEYTVPGTNTTVYYYVHYTGSGNFQDKSGSAKVTISKATLTITAEDVSVEYDGKVQSGLRCKVSGLAEGDKLVDSSVQIKSKDPSVINAGTYPDFLIPSGGKVVNSAGTDVTSYYTIKYKYGKLEIKPRPVEIKWYVDSTFGEEYKPSSFVYTGMEHTVYAKVVNAATNQTTNTEDVVTVSKYDTSKTNIQLNAGKYTTEIRELSNKNYTLKGGKNTTLSWTISKAPLTISVAPGSQTDKFYDGTTAVTSEAAVLEISGLAMGETAQARGEWAYSDPAAGDNKSITISNIVIDYASASSDNYTCSTTELTATGSIKKAMLIIKADDISVPYKQPVPAFTATITGFAEGEDESVLTGELSLESDYTSGSRPGYYKITPSGYTADNYEIQYQDGELIILTEKGELPKKWMSFSSVWVPFAIVGVVIVTGIIMNAVIAGRKRGNRRGKSGKGSDAKTRRLETAAAAEGAGRKKRTPAGESEEETQDETRDLSGVEEDLDDVESDETFYDDEDPDDTDYDDEDFDEDFDDDFDDYDDFDDFDDFDDEDFGDMPDEE